MNPVKELRALLVKPSLQISGTIIEVLQNQSYRVRTTSGSLQAIAAGNAAYKIGDYVMVRDGIIQGRVKNEATIPTYSV